MKKCEYEVITSGELSIENAAANLASRVCEKVKNGWEPVGGVSFVSVQSINGKPFYEAAQALIRRLGD